MVVQGDLTKGHGFYLASFIIIVIDNNFNLLLLQPKAAPRPSRGISKTRIWYGFFYGCMIDSSEQVQLYFIWNTNTLFFI